MFCQAFDMGAQEVHIQAWGSTVQRMSSVAFDLAGIDPERIVVSAHTHTTGVCELPAAVAQFQHSYTANTLLGNVGNQTRVTPTCPPPPHCPTLRTCR